MSLIVLQAILAAISRKKAVIVVISITLFPTAPAVGQQSAQAIWNALRAHDARITTAKTKWKLVLISPAIQKLDPDKAAAVAAEKARQNGDTDAKVESLQKSSQYVEKLYHDGFTQSMSLSFERAANVVRCDVISDIPRNDSTRNKLMPLAHYVDIDDGSESISLSGIGNDPPKRGTLVRDRNDALQHSARGFGEAMLLAHTPITDTFPQFGSRIEMKGKDTCVIERSTGGQFPMTARLTVDLHIMQPKTLEIINPANGAVHIRYELSQYKRTAGGEWTAKQVVGTHTTELGRVSAVWRYQLESAKFGAEHSARPGIVSVPRGTIIGDLRFGSKSPSRSYVVGAKLPTDEQYHALLVNSQSISDAVRMQQNRDHLLSAAPIAAALVIAGAGAVFMRSRSRRRGRDSGSR